MNDCVFCRITKGDIPSYKVYEDKDFMAFLDIHPLNPGHTLVVPKKHAKTVNDYEPFGKYWEAARKVSKAVQKALNPIVVIYIVYGLDVPHAHIHLMPRYKDDGHEEGPNFRKVKDISKEEMQAIAEKIKKAL